MTDASPADALFLDIEDQSESDLEDIEAMSFRLSELDEKIMEGTATEEEIRQFNEMEDTFYTRLKDQYPAPKGTTNFFTWNDNYHIENLSEAARVDPMLYNRHARGRYNYVSKKIAELEGKLLGKIKHNTYSVRGVVPIRKYDDTFYRKVKESAKGDIDGMNKKHVDNMLFTMGAVKGNRRRGRMGIVLRTIADGILEATASSAAASTGGVRSASPPEEAVPAHTEGGMSLADQVAARERREREETHHVHRGEPGTRSGLRTMVAGSMSMGKFITEGAKYVKDKAKSFVTSRWQQTRLSDTYPVTKAGMTSPHTPARSGEADTSSAGESTRKRGSKSGRRKRK